MPPKMQVTDEESIKLLAAYCILQGDKDKIAKYMGITTNAAGIRYAKLIKGEKAKIAAAGLLDDMPATKATSNKRQSPVKGSGGDQKRAKKQDQIDEEADIDEETETESIAVGPKSDEEETLE